MFGGTGSVAESFPFIQKKGSHTAEAEGAGGVRRLLQMARREIRTCISAKRCGEPGGSVRGERANLKGLVLGGGGGRPDSAVSKPNFARKYALESFRRDLHNALLCTVL